MAIYYLGVKSFGRSAGTGGSVSTSAAAYRAGERIRDERTGRVYDHSHRRDVEHKELIVPSDAGDLASRAEWATDRSQLWNMVEFSEPKPNARVAREYVIALPHELDVQQRIVLARTFAQGIADRYHNVVDLALHQPRTDPRNFHAHLLTTTREIRGSGLGQKTIAELTGTQRYELGLPRATEELARIREQWASLANDHLRDAGLDIRISHVPDVTLKPGAKPWLPRVAWEIERRGGHSYLGDRVRAQFARRLQAVATPADGPETGTRKTAEEIRSKAIADWRALRAEEGHEASPRSRDAAAAISAWSLFRQSEAERQISSLRRELGRDDLAL